MFGLFKKSKDKPSSDFQFTDSPDTACISCRHVVTEGQPILTVSHDHDGSWQFLCGLEHSEADAKVISLKQAAEKDPSVNGLYEMPVGVGADRATTDAEWIPYKLAEE
jgi:hypothetical protein